MTWDVKKQWHLAFLGRIVIWDVTLRGMFYYGSYQHLEHIALGHFITFTFRDGTFRSCI
jgi:hypothetical protein